MHNITSYIKKPNFKNDKTTQIGVPYVDKASVEAEIIEVGKREKDVIFKFKPIFLFNMFRKISLRLPSRSFVRPII